MSVVNLTGISADNASVQKEEVVDDFAGSDYINVVNVQDGGVGVAAAPIVLSPMVGQGGAYGPGSVVIASLCNTVFQQPRASIARSPYPPSPDIEPTRGDNDNIERCPCAPCQACVVLSIGRVPYRV